ncbi:unnamed protein product [marine sediment metagenome]|uniref:Uncharacterized protein n=1 Tax=marine sediment metagenome TaxID=412755 RepID=X1EUB0_9ZZZZ
MDEATYPITIDPDFGYTTIGASSTGFAYGTEVTARYGSAWTMPAPGGPANYIMARVYSTTTDHVDCKAFINQKDSGGAGTHAQIATKENLGCVDEEHWEEFTLSGEALTGGVDYILNIMGNEDDLPLDETYRIKYDTDGAVATYVYDPYVYGAPDDPWVLDPWVTTYDYSILPAILSVWVLMSAVSALTLKTSVGRFAPSNSSRATALAAV